MTWFRIDDKSALHSKVVRAGNAAWGAFCRLGAYCADHRTDGFADGLLVPIFASEDEVQRLLDVGLLERVGERDFRLHDFLDWNPSAKDLESLHKKRSRAGRQGASKRKASAEASALASAAASDEANTQQRDGLGVGDLPEGERELERRGESSVRRIRNAADDGAFGDTVSAWCEGISDATSRACTKPTHGQVRQLIEAQQRHRPVTEEKVSWSRSSASSYARAMGWVGGAQGKLLSTFGYVRWLDTGTRQGAAPSAQQVKKVKGYDF